MFDFCYQCAPKSLNFFPFNFACDGFLCDWALFYPCQSALLFDLSLGPSSTAVKGVASAEADRRGVTGLCLSNQLDLEKDQMI